jgi:taurine dioxygenase
LVDLRCYARIYQGRGLEQEEIKVSLPEREYASTELDLQRLTGALGCEIYGADLKNLNDERFAEIHQAFLKYSVLVFRDQDLDEESFAAFGRRFGKLEDEPFLPFRSESTPGVFYLRGAPKKSKTLSTQNLGWHMDHSYQKNPSLGAMLYSIDVPAVGGDTLFASHYEAYDALSPGMQDFLEDKIGIHDVLQYGLNSGHHSTATPASIKTLEKMREKFPQTEHPIVCQHPETGRKMLYTNKAWLVGIKGLSRIENQGVINIINEHALQDRLQCRVRWRNRSLLLWDNRAVQHSPNSDYLGDRLMWRLAIHSDWEPGT